MRAALEEVASSEESSEEEKTQMRRLLSTLPAGVHYRPLTSGDYRLLLWDFVHTEVEVRIWWFMTEYFTSLIYIIFNEYIYFIRILVICDTEYCTYLIELIKMFFVCRTRSWSMIRLHPSCTPIQVAAQVAFSFFSFFLSFVYVPSLNSLLLLLT